MSAQNPNGDRQRDCQALETPRRGARHPAVITGSMIVVAWDIRHGDDDGESAQVLATLILDAAGNDGSGGGR